MLTTEACGGPRTNVLNVNVDDLFESTTQSEMLNVEYNDWNVWFCIFSTW